MARRAQWSLACVLESWRTAQKPADTRWLDILADRDFRASMREVRDLSSLDTARLANLWQWCGLSENGAIVEVGAFRGGTSLHLSNRWPRRRIFVCDTFEGFAPLVLDPQLDRGIDRATWCNRDADAVAALFAERGRDAVLLKGVFPASDAHGDVRDVSFAHVDVDLYESCRGALDYLSQRATPSALFAVNDYLREKTRGVRRAVEDFLAAHAGWTVIPAYPGQALLLDRARTTGPP